MSKKNCRNCKDARYDHHGFATEQIISKRTKMSKEKIYYHRQEKETFLN